MVELNSVVYTMQDYVLRALKSQVEAGKMGPEVYSPKFGRDRVFAAIASEDGPRLAECHFNFRQCGIEIRSFYMLKLLLEGSRLFDEPLQDSTDFELYN